MSIAFGGDLAGENLPLITVSTTGAGGRSTLTGGTNPSATVTETLAGGQTLGPEDADPNTGVITIENVPGGSWGWEVEATNYEDATGDRAITCPGKRTVTVGVSMTVSDGYIVQPGQPGPQQAPATCTLEGDPNGMGSLSLVSCTAGTALYVGTSGPNNITIETDAAPGCPTSPPAIFTRQYWVAWATGCINGLWLVWTMSQQGSAARPPCTNPVFGGSTAGACLPGGNPGNIDCGLCGCSYDSWFSGPSTSTSWPCGPNFGATTQVGETYIAANAIGGGCLTAASSVPLVPGPGFGPGWHGAAAPVQLATIWGQPQTIGNQCVQAPVLETVPCLTASLDT